MAPAVMSRLIPSVGLEIHVRLQTSTKLFCACPNQAHAVCNSLICPVCMGLPGSLPVLSEDAVRCGLQVALALGARVNRRSAFDRKHYFYPDLPRNYQITQYAHPLAEGGRLAIGGVEFRIRRLHLEEDAARILAGPRAGTVAVDLNRAGAPLLEIVTEPARVTGAQARTWLQGLRRLLRYLEVSDGSLEDGSMRCDANVGFVTASGRNHRWRGPWSELKNLNSPGMISRAVDHEIGRLGSLVAQGTAPVRETRSWDRGAGRTRLLRSKEETRDYLYLPEPDLPSVSVTQEQLARLAAKLPELPEARQERLRGQHHLATDAVFTLCRHRVLADYFEATVGALAAQGVARGARPAANWILTEVAGRWDTSALRPEPFPVPPASLADLLQLLADGKISRPTAKQVFAALLADPSATPLDVAGTMGLDEVADEDQLVVWCRQVLDQSAAAVASWRSGKAGALEHLLGRVMALSGGRADPVRVREMLLGLLRPDDSS